MFKKNKTIIIIAAIAAVIILFVLLSGKSEQKLADEKKQAAVDYLYAIWLSINDPKQANQQGRLQNTFVANNEKQIKAELLSKLTLEEITSITEYSDNAKAFLNLKSFFTAESLSLIAYLTNNYQNMKTIMAKTSLGDVLTMFGINIPTVKLT